MSTDQAHALDLLIEIARRRNGGELGLRAWTAINRASLKPDVLFDLKQHPYLADVYDCQAREVVVYKASQMGASEWGVSYALHACDERQATVLYVFPTDTHVNDFSTARIGPALDASPYLAQIVAEGGGEDATGRRRKSTDRVTLKRVRDRFLYMRGAQVKPDGKAPQLKSIDADVLVLDEVDEMDQRAPAIAVKRLGHSRIREIRWISTPTYPGIGIHAKWLESDQREWLLRCPKCNTAQALTIRHIVTEWDALGRPVAWHGDTQHAWAACEKCSAPIDRFGKGEWVAQFPDRPIAGYHLTKLFSQTCELIDLVRALDTVDETKRREAFNQDLGEPYIPRGGRLTETLLDKCRREYAHGPDAKARAVAGIDVGSLLHIVIRALPDESGAMRQLYAGAVETFEELGHLLRRYKVRTSIIDALPETRKARELQAAFRPGEVWLAYFGDLKTEDYKRINEKEYTVSLDRTRTLDAMFAEVYTATEGAGGLTLPANARDIRDYYAQMVDQVRVLEDKKDGNQVAVYRELGPDHFSMAECYCFAAMGMPRATPLPAQDNLTKRATWK